MDKLYGVGITNRYSCFIDNEDLDPLEQLKISENEREAKKKGKNMSGANTGNAEKENRGNKEVTSSSSSSGGGGGGVTSSSMSKDKVHHHHPPGGGGGQVGGGGGGPLPAKGQQDKGSSSDKSDHPHPSLPPSNNTTSSQHLKKKAMDKSAAPNRKGIRDANAPKGNVNVKDNKAPRNDNIDRRPPKPVVDRDRVLTKDRPPQGDRAPATQERQDRPRFNNDEGREARNNRRNQDESRDPEYDARGGSGPRGGGYFRDRERGRGGYARGSRGGSAGGQRKREFDRQSGSDKSGVKAVDKRDGAGSRNWGTYKDELEVTTGEVANDSMEEKVEGVEGAVEGHEEDTENVGDAAADDQPKLMTLDEWKALQQPRAKPVFNLRKAGEGEDPAQWNKMTLKKKEKQTEEDEEEDEEVGEYDCPQRAGRQKQILDVNFHFADSRRGGTGGRGFDGPGRGRGGRGIGGMDRGGRDRPGGDRAPAGERVERGERGDRSDRGDRGGRGFGRSFGRGRGGFSRDDRSPRQTLPKVDDERDFPSLMG